jgi:hypothetical protein
MKVIVEKKEVVGTLKTLLGTFPMLDGNLRSRTDGNWVVRIVDEEGFDNYVVLHGDFVAIPTIVPSFTDVKRVATGEEAQEIEILTAATID